MKNSLKPAIKELERTYKFFNKKFFSGKLSDDIIITIQTAGRKQALGWFWPKRWENGKKSIISEINISAENLKNSDPYEILLHELCHYNNFLKEQKDCSQRQYHNKAFKIEAERVGLIVERSKRFGWAHTSPSEELQKIIDHTLKTKREVFNIFRNLVAKGSKTIKLYKYECDCGYKIRCGKDSVDATCNYCEGKFELHE